VKEKLVDLLCCPQCSASVQLQEAVYDEGEIKEGQLACSGCGTRFPIENYIPRFVGSDNYARGFGFQWNKHARTQIDKFNGTQITTDRFFECTGWERGELEGQRILEAGCGAGRFTDVMLDAGFEVFSLDYSSAVDACLANHGLHPRLHIIQGDMCRVPFAAESFDKVFCFGVLQHTPDVKKSFMSLAGMLRPGGQIATDVYARTLKAMMHYPRYVLRPLAKRLRPEVLYGIIKALVPVLLPISILLKRIPGIGRYIYPLIPVANYWGTLPLDKGQLKEWSVIDTFDWLASWYDQPQTASTLKAWLAESGMKEYEVRRMGSFVGTGTKAERRT
jgi:SAM-dependent methyltransferase/uncharacterized protein YbaR (Trm112 family)